MFRKTLFTVLFLFLWSVPCYAQETAEERQERLEEQEQLQEEERERLLDEKRQNKDRSKIRFLVPLLELGKVNSYEGQDEGNYDDLKTSGYELSFTFAAGWGIGFTGMESTVKINDSDYKFGSNTLDFSYLFGNEWTVDLGVGILFSGAGIIQNSVAEFKTQDASGFSWFSHLGMAFGRFETLLEYRENSFTYKEYEADLSGQTIKLDGEIVVKSAQIALGLGFAF